MEQTGTHGGEPPIVANRLRLGAPSIVVESRSFSANDRIPRKHAGGHGRSPALRWSDPPASTRELLVVCEDPDAPKAQPFVHWIVTGLPEDTDELLEGQPPSASPLGSGALQGKNDMGGDGYFGPAPPSGHGVHHYHFEVFALDKKLDLPAPVTRDRLLAAMRGHVVGWGELVGTYETP